MAIIHLQKTKKQTETLGSLIQFSIWASALLIGLLVVSVLFHLVMLGGAGVWRLINR